MQNKHDKRMVEIVKSMELYVADSIKCEISNDEVIQTNQSKGGNSKSDLRYIKKANLEP